MSSNWLIQDLITLIQQRYPDWNNFTHPPFVKDEIDYKQATATKAQQLLNPDTLQTLLGQADYNTFRDHLIHLGRDNNLLWTNQPSRGDLALLHHPKTDPTTLYPHIFNLLHAPQPSPQRLHTFSQYLHQHDLPNKWTFATYFLFIYHPQTDIFIKPTITRWFLKYMGHATAYHTTPNQDTYHLYQQQIHQLKEDLAAYAPQNMIDLQSFIWVCAREAENRVENLTPEAQIALDIPPTEPLGPIYPLTPAPSPLHLAETNTDNPSPPPNTTPSPPPALTYFTANHPLTPAEQENFPQWQQALQRKGQLIFYGPPGTGKTYTAQRFAQHLTTDTDGFATLIQFHPAYTYEEFIQGLRPFLTETGQLTYRWQNGRFLDICHHARQTTAPCLLIIDEINRANLAHVMGELMYLLEYRHQTINLASGTPFQLPPNLYLIGTMNT
ncbi:MAG TPA: AAA family ATPase, partial [Anaerolineae bacterium]|nr:AAA family ATPase [Anaerolineae bacterium]